MGLIKNIKRRYLNLTGKIKDKWPVEIRIYREMDDGQYILSKETRGRTIGEDENDNYRNYKLEVIDSDLETIEVPYRYFTNRKDGKDELEIVRHTRKSFSPLQLKIECEEAEEGEDVMEKIYSIEQMKKTALNDFDQKTNVVESNEEAWYQDQRIQALILFIGAGIFFVMLGIGYSKVITKPILEKLNNLQTGILPVIGLLGRQKIFQVKQELKR